MKNFVLLAILILGLVATVAYTGHKTLVQHDFKSIDPPTEEAEAL